MMDFQQRKDEILRRSKNRLRKSRLLRRWLISVTVPLLLCVAVLSVWQLSGSVGADNAMSVVNDSKSEAAGELPAGAVQVYVQQEGQETRVYRDTETVAAVAALLDVPIKESADAVHGNGSGNDQSDPEGVPELTQPEVYIVILEMADGSCIHYRLDHTDVYCVETGRGFALTDAQLSAMIRLLAL